MMQNILKNDLLKLKLLPSKQPLSLSRKWLSFILEVEIVKMY